MNETRIRLGVNIDHVATLRNVRGSIHPDIFRAACLLKSAGADKVTVHLREDRRHILDKDIPRIAGVPNLLMNLEVAPVEEMIEIALQNRPYAVCLVPEKREELTTEGGLDIVADLEMLKSFAGRVKSAGIKLSVFIDAEQKQLDAAKILECDAVEFHTGRYAHAMGKNTHKEVEKIASMAAYAQTLGIESHAGHGLTYENIGEIATIPEIVEFNIGHFLVCEAIFVGLEESIHHMRELIDVSRNVDFIKVTPDIV